MTTATNDTIERYTISGAGPYAYSWRIFNDTDLAVVALSTDSPPDVVPLTYLTHYTVTGANESDGGSITLLTSAYTPYAGYTLDIRSNTPEDQPTSIRNQARFLPEIHEDAFDYLSRQIQDLQRRVDRTVRFSDDTLTSGEMTPIQSWLSQYLAIGPTGLLEPVTLTSSGALTAAILGLLLYPRTAAEIAAGVTPSAYNYEPYDLRRYGVLDDGTTDNTSAITSIFTSFAAAALQFYAAPNVKFTFNTVAAAIPNRCVLLDESSINAWDTSGFRQKTVGYVEGDDATAINDFQQILSSGHNSALILDNRGTAASSSGQNGIAMVMWGRGRFTKQAGQEGVRGLARAEFSKLDATRWFLVLRRMVPWAARDYELWYTGKTYAANSYIINGPVVYTTVAGGTAGASEPVHTTGSASDGGITWVVVLPNIDSSVFSVDQHGQIATNTSPVEGAVAYLKSDQYSVGGTGQADLYVAADGISKACSQRMRPTDGAGAEVAMPYLQAQNGVGTRMVNSGATQAGFNMTDARMLELAQNGLAEIVAADADTTPTVAGAGRLILRNTGATSITALDNGTTTQRVQLFFENSNTTLVHNAGTFILRGAVNVNPAVFQVIWMERYSGSAAWFETGRNF